MEIDENNSYIIFVGIIYAIIISFVIIIFIYIAYKIWKRQEDLNKIIVKDLLITDKGNYRIDSAPSILVYNQISKYRDKIYNHDDKILLIYNDSKDRTRYTYIDNKTCQLLDKNDQEVLFEDGLNNARVFGNKNNLYMISNDYDDVFIISLKTMRTYKTECEDNIGYFNLNDRHYMITSVSPLRIDEIRLEDMKTRKNVVDRRWMDNDKRNMYMIKSNGILVNNFIDFICMRRGVWNELIFIRLSVGLHVIGMTVIDMEEEIRPNGLIYNYLTNEYYISYINKKNRVAIYKIKYDLVEYKMRYI
jgi:hypothetical protein